MRTIVWVELSYTIYEARPGIWRIGEVEGLELAGTWVEHRWGDILDFNETPVSRFEENFLFHPSNGADYFEASISAVHLQEPEDLGDDPPGFEAYSWAPNLYSVIQIDDLALIPPELIRNDSVPTEPENPVDPGEPDTVTPATETLLDQAQTMVQSYVLAYASSRGIKLPAQVFTAYGIGDVIATSLDKQIDLIRSVTQDEISPRQFLRASDEAKKDMIADVLGAGGVPPVVVEALRMQSTLAELNADPDAGDEAGNPTFRFTGDAKLVGSSHNDAAVAGDGENTILGHGGDDFVAGGKGADKIKAGSGKDWLFGGKGKDKALGNSGADKASGEGGKDVLKGQKGADVLKAGRGKDELVGGPGADVLKGQKGKDMLNGGPGKDKLSGGRGNDTFKFKKLKDSPDGRKHDVITDLNKGKGDKIDLRKIDAKKGVPGNQAFDYIGESKFGGDKGVLRSVERKKKTFVYGDVDGDGRADLTIELKGAHDLSKGDFVL